MRGPGQLTDSMSDVCLALESMFEVAKTDLGLKDVFFGQTDLFPETPALSIEPNLQETTRSGAPQKMHHEFSVYLMVYHSPLRAKEVSARELLAYSETIRDFVHSGSTTRLLGDYSASQNLLLDGYISRMEPGFTVRQNSMVRTARLTFFGISETLMPTS